MSDDRLTIDIATGFENAASAAFTGPLDIVDIGLPRALVRLLDVQTPS